MRERRKPAMEAVIAVLAMALLVAMLVIDRQAR
jgi:hypothetical protein